MTDTAISPLRRRMIEDMTIRKLGPKTSSGLHPGGQELCRVPWTFTRPGKRRRHPPLSAQPRVQRPRRSQRERGHDGATLLLQGHPAKG